MHASLVPGTQMMFRHKSRKLNTLLFFFFVLVNLVAQLNVMGFFCGTNFLLKLCPIPLLLKRLQVGSKRDFATKGVILKVLVAYDYSRRNPIFMN